MTAIRHAEPSDASAIAAIWNPLIRDTAITFTTLQRSAAEVAEMIRARHAAGLAFLVATEERAVLGFSTCAPFRAGPGYARTMEHTVILAPRATGRGIGRALIEALAAQAATRGVHSLIGGISGENAGAIAFHARCGFVEVGRVPEAGRKFGRWLDLVLMQRRL